MNTFEVTVDTPPSYTNPFWRKESASHDQSIVNEYDDGAPLVQPRQSMKYPKGDISDSSQEDDLQEASHDYDKLIDQFLTDYSPLTALFKPAANARSDKPLSTNESPQCTQQQPLSIHCPRPLRATPWNSQAVPAYIQSLPTAAPPQYQLPSQVIQPTGNDTSQYPNSPGPYQRQAGSATHHGEAEPIQKQISNRAPCTGNFTCSETGLIEQEQDCNSVVPSDGSHMQGINEVGSKPLVQPHPVIYPPIIIQLTEHHLPAQSSNKRKFEIEIASETSTSIGLQRPIKRSRAAPSSDSASSSNTPTPSQRIDQKRKKIRRIGREKIGNGFILQRDLRQAKELIHVAETIIPARKVLECTDNECEMEESM